MRIRSRRMFAFLATPFLLSAQTSEVQTFSAAQIAEFEPALHAQADASNSNGTASRLLTKYPNYYTSLIYRDKDGQVEVHNRFDEIMIILEGSAKIVTGGTGQNLRTTAAGELRGIEIVDGTPGAMEKGSTIHIPAGTPHQVFVPNGGSVTYIDIKIAHTHA
jgi:mannose-6-phosphate isomerase-like protein (cupin superfamily)